MDGGMESLIIQIMAAILLLITFTAGRGSRRDRAGTSTVRSRARRVRRGRACRSYYSSVNSVTSV